MSQMKSEIWFLQLVLLIHSRALWISNTWLFWCFLCLLYAWHTSSWVPTLSPSYSYKTLVDWMKEFWSEYLIIPQVLAMCFIRKSLDWVFTHHELKWLDDIMPEAHKKEKEEKKKKMAAAELLVTVRTSIIHTGTFSFLRSYLSSSSAARYTTFQLRPWLHFQACGWSWWQTLPHWGKTHWGKTRWSIVWHIVRLVSSARAPKTGARLIEARAIALLSHWGMNINMYGQKWTIKFIEKYSIFGNLDQSE